MPDDLPTDGLQRPRTAEPQSLTADSPLDTTRPGDAVPLVGDPSAAVAGRYHLSHELARGGMGVVYAARDTVFDRDVAVKLIQPDRATPTAARRFTDEARITARLQHPGIPAVFDMGTLPDGRTFLAMKLVRGRTLADVLADPAPGPLLPAFEQLCHAVAYAHSRGVIHRDLKPANVMIGAFGEVQVMDWGLAKFLASGRREPAVGESAVSSTIHDPRADPDSSGTHAGSILGTPAYMPPEQAIGAIDQTDERADVFGLGAILCTILTGQPPWVGVTGESTRQLAARAELTPAFARLDASGGEPDLIALAKRCLSAKPEDRPRHAGEVAVAVTSLRAAADARAKQAEQEKLTAEVRADEQAKRRRAVQWAAGVVAAVLVLGVVGTTLGLIRADTARWAAEAAERATEAKRAEAEAAQQAEAKQKVLAQEKEAEANAVVAFFQDKVFAAGRPKGQFGGLNHDVSLRTAITASLPALATGFADKPLVEARLRMALGGTFWFLGDAQAATEQYERVRAIFTERRGPDHPDTLANMHNLANSYADLNRHTDALKLREETLAGRRRVLPPDHPITLASMDNLANSYADLNRHADALKLREETLAGYQRVLPPDHPNTLASMDNLANSYAQLNRHTDALKLREETLAGFRRVLPPDHPTTLLSMNNLAVSYAALSRHADALKLHEETLAARKRVLPPDHPDTLLSMYNLAHCYADLNRHADAVKLYEETLAGRRRVLPPDHPATLASMNNLANSYAALSRHADALKLHEETLAVRKRVLPPNHPDTLYSLWGTAASLVKLNRSAEAIPLIDECVIRATGKVVDPRMIPTMMDLRLRHFENAADPVGCRTTAVMWEKQDLPDAGSLYDAACNRAIAAALYAKVNQPAEATADADKAMAWLTKAVAAGWKNRGHMETDDDLAFLRNRADFRALVATMRYQAPTPRPMR